MEKNKPVSAQSTRVLQSRLVKTIGDRLREAREIANLSQTVAARRLGYSNPSKLSKVEKATDTNSVPHWLILRAARLYEVSIDFLYGATEDWELTAKKCIDRDIDQWVIDAWEIQRQRDMEVLMRLHRRFKTVDSYISTVQEAITEAYEALNRFIQINSPGFDDMRGGSRLVSSVGRAYSVTRESQVRMTRFRDECSAARVAKVVVDSAATELEAAQRGPTAQMEIEV